MGPVKGQAGSFFKEPSRVEAGVSCWPMDVWELVASNSTGGRVPNEKRKHHTKGGLTRETAYLYRDEETALEARAAQERCSKSEIIRRALRMFLQVD